MATNGMKRLSDSVKFTVKFWANLGERLTKMLLIRTFTKGIGADGKRFKGYSEAYKEFRQKKGRKVTPVTHFFKGDFALDLQRRRTTKKSVEYGWDLEGEKVDWALNNDRDILGVSGVSKKEGKLIEDLVGVFIEKKIKIWANKSVTVRVG